MKLFKGLDISGGKRKRRGGGGDVGRSIELQMRKVYGVRVYTKLL